jgi:hypothetical protein
MKGWATSPLEEACRAVGRIDVAVGDQQSGGALPVCVPVLVTNGHAAAVVKVKAVTRESI